MTLGAKMALHCMSNCQYSRIVSVGHGSCICEQNSYKAFCECEQGYMGAACDCPVSKETCKAKTDEGVSTMLTTFHKTETEM